MQAGAGQAQRGADDRRQPQGTPAEGDQTAQPYAMSLGESVASGPFFKAYVANLLPGQFLQPFIDAAFSDLGLDPNVLLPSELHRSADRSAGDTGAAGAVPADRAGRRTAAHPARRDHRQSRRSATRTASRCRPRRPAVRRPARRCRAQSSRAHPARGAIPSPIRHDPRPATRHERRPGPCRVAGSRVGGAGRAAGRWRPGARADRGTINRRSSPRISRTAMASIPATMSASSASRSARSKRSSRSRNGPRSPSGWTESTRCPPTPRR